MMSMDYHKKWKQRTELGSIREQSNGAETDNDTTEKGMEREAL